MRFRTLACLATAGMLTACSGGGGGVSTTGTSVQQVSGTLAILTNRGSSPSSVARKPNFVSASTTHAAVFINGATTANGTSTSCSATSGTGTACTISWTAALAVPASYPFRVEIDDGHKILGEGQGTYALVSGNNTLTTLSLNGVAADATFTVTSCSNASNPGSCSGNVTLADADNNAISYTGTTVVPTTGVSPTSGNVFDNDPITLTASNSTGLVTGIAQTSGSNTFSTFGSNTLTISGVDTTGVYTYSVSCASTSSTGTFGITVGGGTGPSTVGAPLGTLTYNSGVTTLPTVPSFACNSGVISSVTGTLPVN